MRFIRCRGWVVPTLKILLGLLFLYSGISKLKDLQAFADNVAAFQLFGAIFANLVALTIPMLEVILGGTLILGLRDRAASLGLALLGGIFAIAFLQAAIRGLSVDCGCFGASESTGSNVWFGFVRAIGIVAAALWIYYAKKDELSR